MSILERLFGNPQEGATCELEQPQALAGRRWRFAVRWPAC